MECKTLKKKDKKVWRALAMVTQISISMLVPILMCCVFGYYLNRWFHVSFWFPILFLLGVAASIRNTYLITRSFYAADLKKEQEELKYFEDLKNYSKNHSDVNEPEDRKED